MTTAIDTNVIVALWDAEDALYRPARVALEAAQNEGGLVIVAPVYAELMAGPGRSEKFIDQFCEDTHIAVEWDLEKDVWRAAGAAFQRYAAQRRRQRDSEVRRILADFVIGAHAWVSGYRLLTLDDRLYKAAFPKLQVVTV
jgi:predicted nucleic acid-binding protein